MTRAEAERERIRKARESIQRAPCGQCGAEPPDRSRMPSGKGTRMPHFARRERAAELGYHLPGESP